MPVLCTHRRKGFFSGAAHNPNEAAGAAISPIRPKNPQRWKLSEWRELNSRHRMLTANCAGLRRDSRSGAAPANPAEEEVARLAAVPDVAREMFPRIQHAEELFALDPLMEKSAPCADRAVALHGAGPARRPLRKPSFRIDIRCDTS